MAECKEIAERLLDWVEGETSGAEQARIAQHLEGCRACSGEAKALQALIRGIGELPQLAAPAGLEARVMARVRKAGDAAGTARRSLAPVGFAAWWPALTARPMAVGAAFALLLMVFTGLGLRGRVAPSGGLMTAAVPSGVRLEVAAGSATLDGGARAVSGMELAEGGVIEVSEDFKGKLLYPDGTTVRVRAGATVRVFARSLGLKEGQVWLNVKKGGAGFQVETAQAVVAVRGTVFGVDCDAGRQETKVVVEEGAVEVKTSADSLLLGAGQSARAGATLELLNREGFDSVFGLDRDDFVGKPKRK